MRKQQESKVCAETTVLIYMYIKQRESKQEADLCGLLCVGRLSLFFIYVVQSDKSDYSAYAREGL